MSGRALPRGLYGFDVLRPGDWWETSAREITATMIDHFADLSGDRFAIQMDDAAARTHGFRGRVAHGLLVLSVIDGLKNAAPVQITAIASLGWDWQFRKPVLIEDDLSARITVCDLRETSNPARGIVTLDFAVSRKDGTLVQQGKNQLMAYRQTT